MTHHTTSNGSFLSQVTPIVLTYNEEPNIAACLSRLRAFKSVLVVDSFSTDSTLDIVASHENTRVIQRVFDSFAGQWNYAIREGGVETAWVLAMDADYMITDEFIRELGNLSPGPEINAFRIAFDYCVFGRKLSSTLYPPIVALYRHAHTHYVQDGHCMRAQISGPTRTLRSKVLHDDRKPLTRWLASQAKYAEQEAELLLSKPATELRVQDRLRKLIFIAPWLVPLYCLTVGRAILDGRAGWFYAMQRGVAEAVLSLKLLEEQLKSKAGGNG